MAPYEIDEYGNVIYVPGGSGRPSTPSYVSGGGMSTLPPSTSTAITADDTIGGWGSSTSTSTTPTVVATIPRSIVEANRYYQTQPAPTPSRPSGMYGITPDPFEEEIMRPKPTPTTSTTPSTPTVVATIPRSIVEANRYYQTQPVPTTSATMSTSTSTRTTTSSSTSTSTPTTTTQKTEEKKSGSFLDDLFKPIRDWLKSIGLEGEPIPDEHWIQEAEMYYNEIENIMSSIPDSFYKASGGYWKLKTKKDFLDAAWQHYYEATEYRRNVTGNAMELDNMADFARSLRDKWEKEKNKVLEKAIEKEIENRTQPSTQPGTTPIAEEQPKPTQTTNYMSYGFIAIIAILVIVLIFVLRRK
jgi:hypothetical protein